MWIDDWMRENGKTVVDLAEQCEVSRQTVYGWLNVDFLPSAAKLMRLHEVTGGEVSLDDFRAKWEEKNGSCDGVEIEVCEGLERRRCGGSRPSSGS